MRAKWAAVAAMTLVIPIALIATLWDYRQVASEAPNLTVTGCGNETQAYYGLLTGYVIPCDDGFAYLIPYDEGTMSAKPMGRYYRLGAGLIMKLTENGGAVSEGVVPLDDWRAELLRNRTEKGFRFRFRRTDGRTVEVRGDKY